MKSEIYKLLKKDLKEMESTVNIDENSSVINDLKDIIEEVEKILKAFGGKVTDEDIKIIVSNKYINRLSDIAYQKHMQHDKKEIEKLENDIYIFKKYFKDEKEVEEYSRKESYSFGNINECQRIMNFINQDRNGISKAFNTCAILLIIFGIICSIVMGVVTYSFLTFLIAIITILFSALILYGFAELFQILHDIRKRLYLQK